VPGEVSPSFTLLGLEASERRNALGRQFVERLAAIHAVDWRALGLDFLGVPERGSDAYPSAVVACLDEQLALRCPERPPLLQRALDWLRANRLRTESIALCHGDYKTDNFVFEGERITGILDWEFAHLGDPLEDLGWVCMDLYSSNGLRMGLMEREQLLADYERLSGKRIAPERLRFWEVANNVRMVAFTYFMLEASKRRADLFPQLGAEVDPAEVEAFTMSMVGRMLDDLQAQLGQS